MQCVCAVCVLVRVCVCAHVRACVCLCMYIYVCMYAFRIVSMDKTLHFVNISIYYYDT